VRAVIQRIKDGQIAVGEEIISSVGPGLCIFLAVGRDDTDANVNYLTDKIIHLRIFDDEQGKMNRSFLEVTGELLVVSEFTLYGDCTRGNRPSFSEAAPPPEAERLYECFVRRLQELGLRVSTGRFRAKMNVALINDGPVTFILDG